ncbi:MAG: glycosyltransferase family 2 protein [Burkholderiales bacterium]
MNAIDISVVTVVYNGCRFIEETMASVRAQIGPLVEHWVIDGGSTDGTLDIIRLHASGLAGWLSEPDEGIADAFNKGLSRATGRYVMFLNADDALTHPRVLANLLDAARAGNWPAVVYGDCDLFDPDSGEFLYRAVINYDRERFLARETLPHPGMLMHRRYFDEYGRFDTSFRVAMDYELLLRGVPKTGAMRVPGVVTRVRAGGVSARNRGLVIDETMRALRMHGHISALGEARIRATYAMRGAARRALEGAGLYRAFDAIRRRRTGAKDNA